MHTSIEIEGRGGPCLRGTIAIQRETGAPGIVIIGESAEHALRVATEFAHRGFAALALDLGDGALLRDERRALGLLEDALALLAQRREVVASKLAALGFGLGGTLAYELGCTSWRLACAIDVHGPLVHPELSAARPMQPLEYALNLSVPLLAAFGERDPAITSEHRELWRRLLDQGFKHVEFVNYRDAREGFWDRASPNHRADDAQDLEQRTLAFLREQLELGT